LLSKGKKTLFTLINDQSHQGEVLKISLAFERRKKGPENWNVVYDEVEENMLSGYGEKVIKERIFCALGLAAKFLN
jgi:hypothetical protein